MKTVWAEPWEFGAQVSQVFIQFTRKDGAVLLCLSELSMMCVCGVHREEGALLFD